MASLREVVVDTETTGLDPDAGHRIVEIGCVELVNHLPSGRHFQSYLDPERDMPAEAERVHGLSRAFLTGKPLFKDVASAFLEFLDSDRLIIHNAAFDLKFLNAELAQIGQPGLESTRVCDTLELARRRYPGVQNSLDALCRRFSIDLSARQQHGALLDAGLLAQVYLELVGGREPGLDLAAGRRLGGDGIAGTRATTPARRVRPVSSLLTEEEKHAHEALLDSFPVEALWRAIARADQA